MYCFFIYQILLLCLIILNSLFRNDLNSHYTFNFFIMFIIFLLYYFNIIFTFYKIIKFLLLFNIIIILILLIINEIEQWKCVHFQV